METANIFSENVIIIDATYINHVAFDLTVNFERMLERRINQADIPTLLDCMALDGGLQPGQNQIQVIFVYKKLSPCDYLNPSNIASLDGKAFQSNLGEFTIQALPLEENLIDANNFMTDIFSLAIESKKTHKIVLAPDTDKGAQSFAHIAKDAKKQITILAMSPLHGSGFTTEILGYSLMQAMNIKSEELIAHS